MKVFILLVSIIFLSACSLTHFNEIKHAEKMLSHFQCNKIESAQMTHTSITAYYEQSLALSRQKAESYVQSYTRTCFSFIFRCPIYPYPTHCANKWTKW